MFIDFQVGVLLPNLYKVICMLRVFLQSRGLKVWWIGNYIGRKCECGYECSCMPLSISPVTDRWPSRVFAPLRPVHAGILFSEYRKYMDEHFCVSKWVFMHGMWAGGREGKKKHGKAERGNKAFHQQTSFVTILTRRVETAALFKRSQQFPLSVQSRRHFDWLCED